MGKINIDSILLSSGKNAELNTWNYYNKVMPNIQKTSEQIILKTDTYTCKINSYDEALLYILVIYSFAPVWIMRQWIDKEDCFEAVSNRDYSKEKILNWINIGLVWCQPSVTGEYLRPTYLLFELFNERKQKFKDIPYNQLTHTISEEQVTFEILTGQKESAINKYFNKLYIPRYSPLGFDIKDSVGTNVIGEHDFKSTLIYSKLPVEEINETEYQINKGIQERKIITEEFNDFSKFMIVNKLDNTGDVSKDFRFHIPDLIIPIPRRKSDSSAQSIAIEVELTSKGYSRYVRTLEDYRNNNKFGYIIWYSNDAKITELLKKAYSEVGGLGNNIKMAIFEFTVPSPSTLFNIK